MLIETLKSLFKTHKEPQLFHRYVHTETIVPLLNKMSQKTKIDVIGTSVCGEKIYSLTVGSGFKKVLMWSQMHGNESTTTKALFDVFNVLNHDQEVSKSILEACTIKVIPILNPDGAKAYTRLNANNADLNRDAQDLTQPESKILREVFDAFKPEFCFNLHGQRTIFSAGISCNPATVSFLAPSQDAGRTVTVNRKRAMEVIAVMHQNLQRQIPNQIGIYDDTFNINCVGDRFQSCNVPTILFEAGHFKGDYEREETRVYIFQSLLVSLDYIASKTVTGDGYDPYLGIPQNEKQFFDLLIRNTAADDIGIMYQEKLVDDRIEFVPRIESISDLSGFYGHKEVDANSYKVLTTNGFALCEGNEIDYVNIGNEKFSLILKNN